MFRVLRFLVPPPVPLPLFALNLPHKLAAAADALPGMVYIHMLFLLFHPQPTPHAAVAHVLPGDITLLLLTAVDRSLKHKGFEGRNQQ
jgi:hypothetical protein